MAPTIKGYFSTYFWGPGKPQALHGFFSQGHGKFARGTFLSQQLGFGRSMALGF